MNELDIIIGIHSIVAALKNPLRGNFEIFCSKAGLSDFKKYYAEADKLFAQKEVKVVYNEKIQELAEKTFRQFGHHFQRVPGNIFLICPKIDFLDNRWLEQRSRKPGPFRLLALDQVTDLHNGAAILRTAAFYNLDAIIIPQKGAFGLTPTFFRISSGAVEYVPIVKTSNLSKTVQILEKEGVSCLGFSEHGQDEGALTGLDQTRLCLIHGAEEDGLSHSVERVLKNILRLPSRGEIKSLNVSVAAAITMEKFFT